jgi:hypothetical protein
VLGDAFSCASNWPPPLLLVLVLQLPHEVPTEDTEELLVLPVLSCPAPSRASSAGSLPA